jgi:hypothetical protein
VFDVAPISRQLYEKKSEVTSSFEAQKHCERPVPEPIVRSSFEKPHEMEEVRGKEDSKQAEEAPFEEFSQQCPRSQVKQSSLSRLSSLSSLLSHNSK